MKRFSFWVFVLGVLFLSFGLKVSALESTVLQKVDSQSIYQQLSFRQSFKSKKYRDGMIENYFVVETSGVADLRKNWKVCALSDYHELYSSTPLTVNRKLKEDYPTFVAFDSTDIRDGYAYTLLNGLGLCNDENTVSKNVTGIKFNSTGIVTELWTTALRVNHSNYTFSSIPTGKRGVQLVLVGDVIAITITIKQYQKLWLGDNKIFEKNLNAYICCNTQEVEWYE